MKRLLPFLLVLILAAFVFGACNRKPPTGSTDGQVLTYTDTIGLAEFQKWKALNELKDPAVFYQQTSESAYMPARRVVRSHAAANSSTSMNSVGQYPAKTSMKKGWSRKAKGAVIGGGGGAIIGALVDKHNRLAGGALGGALGAGIGYIVGNELDRKHGR